MPKKNQIFLPVLARPCNWPMMTLAAMERRREKKRASLHGQARLHELKERDNRRRFFMRKGVPLMWP